MLSCYILLKKMGAVGWSFLRRQTKRNVRAPSYPSNQHFAPTVLNILFNIICYRHVAPTELYETANY